MKIDSGDTAWVLASAALVMLMTPALGFFYGGLVRRKNVLSTIMHSFFILCLISVQWVLWGYSLAFGPDKFHIIGGLEWVGLNNVGFTPNADYAPTIPHQAFMVFQMMFAVITPALISGAFAERQRFICRQRADNAEPQSLVDQTIQRLRGVCSFRGANISQTS